MDNVSLKLTKKSFDFTKKEQEVLDYLSSCLQARAKSQKRPTTDTFERTEQDKTEDTKMSMHSEKMQKTTNEMIPYYLKYKDFLCFENLRKI